jgi:recombination associated protein RdgC
MFKNLSIFRIVADFFQTPEADEARLDAARFAPCGSMQEKSAGWVPPRGEAHGSLVECVAGQRILKLMIQTKSVPGAAVREKAQVEADAIERDTGRKPGKKQMKELREDALLALLPQAFPKKAAVLVWVDVTAGLVMIDASSQGQIDDAITALVMTFQGLSMVQLQTTVAPQTAMARWLDDEENWPEDFSVEHATELKSSDESKATVKFDHHQLMIDEVRKHMAEGKLPVSLAMSFDGRVAFTLTDALRLKKISFLDGAVAEDAEDGFDADVVIATGELAPMIAALVDALGGELVGVEEDLT